MRHQAPTAWRRNGTSPDRIARRFGDTALLIACIVLGAIAIGAAVWGIVEGKSGKDEAMPGLSATATEELVRIYGGAMDDVNAAAGKAILQLGEDPTKRSAQFRLDRAARLQAEIADRLRVLNVQVERTLTPALVAGLTTSITQAERESIALMGVGKFETRSIDKLAQDSAALTRPGITGPLSAAARSHAENASGVFRRLSTISGGTSTLARGSGGIAKVEIGINRAIARGLITGDPRAIEKAVREGIGQGVFGEENALSYRRLGNQYIQVGNATLSVRDYAKTVARTRAAEAAIDAARDRMGEFGIDAAIIVGRESENFCTAYLGLIVGLSGPITIDGVTFPALDDLPDGGPPFHPKCSKGISAYDPELSDPGLLEIAKATLTAGAEEIEDA